MSPAMTAPDSSTGSPAPGIGRQGGNVHAATDPIGSHGSTPGGHPVSPLESSAELIARLRSGDLAARDQILGRYLAPLRRWAHGRLPARARGMVDTDDLVQICMIRALSRLEDFECRHEGAFLAYLRKILLNQIREEVRRALRRPEQKEIGDDLHDCEPSPLEQTIGKELASRYETALGRLTGDQQQAVVLRVEFGLTYQQVADALDRPTPNAARLLVTRALLRLARLMHEFGREA
jgi:RNA polymerase sigma-70 factor, ECF subfamily